MTTTIPHAILAITIVLLLSGWLFWLIEFRAHRLEITRHRATKTEMGAINRILSEYETAARSSEVLSKHTETVIKLLAMQAGTYDPREGREN